MLERILSPKHSVSVSPSIVVFTTLFLLSLLFFYQIRSILLLLFTAFIVMVALHPVVKKLEVRLKLNRIVAAAISYILFLVLVLIVLGLLLPPLARELYALLRTVNLPVLQNEIMSWNFDLLQISNLAERIGSSVGVVFQVINSTFSGIFTIFTLLVLSFYLMLERPQLHKKIAWFSQKEEHFRRAKQFLDSLEVQLGGWVRGQAILMLVIGVLNYLGLLLLNVPYALPLALIAGLLEILPNLGPIISTILASIIAFIAHGPLTAGLVVLLGLLIQQIENSFLVPKVMRENANVNPLTSILAILIGLEVGGVLGALLSIPLYITLRAVYGTFFRARVKAE